MAADVVPEADEVVLKVDTVVSNVLSLVDTVSTREDKSLLFSAFSTVRDTVRKALETV